MGCLGNNTTDFVNLVSGNIHGCRDVIENSLGSFQRNVFQQGAHDGTLGGLAGAVFTRGDAGAHKSEPGLAHDCAHVGKIEIDQPFFHDHVRNTFDGIKEHVIGFFQHFGEGSFFGRKRKQAIIGDGDQAVHMLLELHQPRFGSRAALRAFKTERFGHHAHGERSHFLGGLGDHRRGAGACSASHPRRHKDHIRILQGVANAGHAFQGRLPPHLRIGARPQSFGEFLSQLDLAFGRAFVQRLQIRIRTNKTDAAQT